MSLVVAIVGHSQVPLEIENPNAEVVIFRRPGACLEHLSESPLVDVFELQPDLVFLYLGGNDIANHQSDCRPIIEGLKSALLKLKGIAKEVRFVQVERRHYTPGNRFNVDNDAYEWCRKRINANLRYFCKRENIRTLNTTKHLFEDNLAADGVHFDPEARAELIKLFNSGIEYCRLQQQSAPSMGASSSHQ